MTQASNRATSLYHRWLQDPLIDMETKIELQQIAGQPEEIEDRFYQDLAFGTGGLRGMMGAGTNRMNAYTVGRATQGLAQYIQHQSARSHAVVIAYDSRNHSAEFALEAALVLAGNGIKAFLFAGLRPTPELSFAVRLLQASAGVVITASHNPPEYNGYKVYGSDGAQLVPQYADQVTKQIQLVDAFSQVLKLSQADAESHGLLQWIGAEVDQQYIAAVASLSCNLPSEREAISNYPIVYSPLHGAGNELVRTTLRQVGFHNVHVVPEQEKPDALFSTVKSPNPEEREAFTLAIAQGKRIGAELLIATDPDSDRMGAVVRNHAGDYVALTGNQTAALMIHYVLQSRQRHNRLPANGVLISTIVSGGLGSAIAAHFGVETIRTLTGFKYIGEKIGEFEQTGQSQFVFGYEESYGYLAGTYCRDKDAVLASMLICEAGAHYRNLGKSLDEVLEELYEKHGYFLESLQSRTLMGKEGLQQIKQSMDVWRHSPPQDIDGIPITEKIDYSQGIDGLPQENVLKFILQGDAWFCLRPSGTEPKLKVYFSVREHTREAAERKVDKLVRAVMARIDQY